MLCCLATLFCACGGRVILEQGGTSGGTTGAGGAGTSGNGTSGNGTSGDFTTTAAVGGVTVASTTGEGTFSSSTGGGIAATCDQYCQDLEIACDQPGLYQYSDFATCEHVCATFIPGNVGDMTGNSLECRAYHAAAAKVTGSTVHCAHAGPTGGDQNPADSMAGPCGEACDSFCNLALKVCPTTFNSSQDCQAQCQAFKASAQPYSTFDMSGDTYSCRMYHLSVAAIDGSAAATHCPHIVLKSLVCK